jgi:hypothetical protein
VLGKPAPVFNCLFYTAPMFRDDTEAAIPGHANELNESPQFDRDIECHCKKFEATTSPEIEVLIDKANKSLGQWFLLWASKSRHV